MPDSLQLVPLSAGEQQLCSKPNNTQLEHRWEIGMRPLNADAIRACCKSKLLWNCLSASLQIAQCRNKHGRVETGEGCSRRDCFNGERMWNDTIWRDRQLSGRKCPAGNVKFRAAVAQVKATTNARSLMQHRLNCFLVKSLAFDQATCPQWRIGLVPQTSELKWICRLPIDEGRHLGADRWLCLEVRLCCCCCCFSNCSMWVAAEPEVQLGDQT